MLIKFARLIGKFRYKFLNIPIHLQLRCLELNVLGSRILVNNPFCAVEIRYYHN